MFKTQLVLLPCLILLIGCSTDNQEVPEPMAPSGTWPDAVLPISEPQVFAEGWISTGLNERDLAVAPDGNEIYFTIWTGVSGTIVSVRKQADGTWSSPETALFSGHYSDMEPSVAPDGERIYFASTRPNDGTGDAKDYDIWFVQQSESGWSEPINAGRGVNTEGNEFFPSVTGEGDLYFTAAREDAIGSEDLYVAPPLDGRFGMPENLGAPVNSVHDEFNAHISPDGNRLVFSIWGRQDDFGGGDMYVSHRSSDGSWSTPENLGPDINTPALDYCPGFSPDGDVFFFTSRRTTLTPTSDTGRTYASLSEELNAPGNGGGDVYWIPSSAVSALSRSSEGISDED